VSDNIIDFTKAFEQRKQRDEEIDALIKQSDKEIADVFAMANARETVWALRGMGIKVEDNVDSMRDILTIIEASKALVFRSIGEEYAFQMVSDAVFQEVEKEAEVSLSEMLEKFLNDMETYFEGMDD